MDQEQHSEQVAEQNDLSAKKVNISVPAAIVTAAAIIGLAIIFTFGPKGTGTPSPATKNAENGQPTSVAANIATVRSADYVRGTASADVVIIEYSDSDCPYCAQFHKTMQETLASYDGKVSWVYRHYPLTSLHPNARNEALALTCVGELGGQKAFWLFLDTVMGVTLGADDSGMATLTTLALQHSINGNLFASCMQSNETKAAVDASIAEAQSIGARGTPFSVAVNQKSGKQAVIPGAVPAEYLKQTIDSLLK